MNHWGKDTKPKMLSDNNWKKPRKWNKKDSTDDIKVFCGSMCDWTDKNTPEGQLERLWGVIKDTPNLSWQMLTKIEPLLEDLGDVDFTGIDWVIVGGESGNKARPMKEEWMLNIKRQCEEQGVPFFFKQWGGRVNKDRCDINGIEIKQWPYAAKHK